VDIVVEEEEGDICVREVSLGRTARKLMEGTVFVNESVVLPG
jgi:2-methylaconitate cis-trans-isomerase PrpF